MTFWDFCDKYVVYGLGFLFTIFVGYHTESIIMSLPFVDKKLLWILSPFVFLSLGGFTYHESRIRRLEKKINRENDELDACQ